MTSCESSGRSESPPSWTESAWKRGSRSNTGMISKAIENAQKRVEGQNFDIRKHLLEYDDVMNRQRQVIYEQRKKVLKGEALWEDVEEMIEEIVEEMVPEYVDEKRHPEDWDLKGLDEEIFRHFTLRLNLSETGRGLGPEAIGEKISAEVKKLLRNKETEYGKPLMDYLMKVIMLQSIDTQWKENLLAMDHLKEGIGLRGYGQKDPVREYQKEGYDMFMDMISRSRRIASKNSAWFRSGARKRCSESRKSSGRITSCRGGRIRRRRRRSKGMRPRWAGTTHAPAAAARNIRSAAANRRLWKRSAGRPVRDVERSESEGIMQISDDYRVPGFLANGIHAGIKADGGPGPCADLFGSGRRRRRGYLRRTASRRRRSFSIRSGSAPG